MPGSRPSKPFVSGIGICAAAGSASAQNFESAKLCKNFFRQQHVFPSPKFGGKLCGESENFSKKFSSHKMSKCAKLLFSSIDEALKQANLGCEQKKNCGIFLGTSIGGVFETEECLRKKWAGISGSLSALRYYECSSLADMAAKKFGLGGMRMTFSTACSSSGLAMEAAVHALSEGRISAALVCGVDALSRITVNGFGSLLLLSNSCAKPFDKNRDGINLGEGAGAVVLVNETDNPLARIESCACTCDAHHATAPHPEGLGLAKALNEALECAGIDKSKISWICAHGTGTEGNDISEFAAFKNIWGENIPPYFSLKGIFGHTLGASAIINAAISIEALNEGKILPSAGFSDLDDSMPKAPNTKLENFDAQYVVSNSLGFGGNNSTSVISKSKEKASASNDGRKLFIYSCGIVSPFGNSISEIRKNAESSKEGACDTSAILADMPPLKKRRLARMQQMALEAASQSLAGIDFYPQKTCICFATGLGMTEQTEKFLEGVLRTNELEASPTAFINSVHNAPASAIANAYKITGINSALTAKELSFESALWQAQAQLKYASSESAVIAAADEKNTFIDAFKKSHSIYCKSALPTGEGATAYFAGLEGDKFSAKAIVRLLEFAPKMKNADLDAAWVAEALNANGICADEISACFYPSAVNRFEKSVYKKVFAKIRAKKIFDISERAGLSYINSSYFPALAIIEGKGLYLQLSLSSAGAKALTVLDVL